MRGAPTGKIRVAPFEFQRNGPIARKPGGHKPDFTLSITKPSVAQSKSTQPLPTPRRHKPVILHGILAVDIVGSSDLSGAKTVDASGRHLTDVDKSTIAQMTGCTKADFSDNALALEPFSLMRNLVELDFSCNSLRMFDFQESQDLVGDDTAWKSLRVLNLGFNSCSNCLSELSNLSGLVTLNLAHNNISSLPPHLMDFTALANLNLSGNALNTEACFLALATLPSLAELNLDDNQIARIPRIEFGFERLTRLSLRSNKLELPEDIDALTDLDELESVDICKNPLVLRIKYLTAARKIFQSAGIDLVAQVGEKPKKRVLAGPLRTVTFDPLTLPSFSPRHCRALNKKRREQFESPKQAAERELEKPAANDVFITGFESTTDDHPPIPPTPLPPPQDDEPDFANVWTEIPIAGAQKRQTLTPKSRENFDQAFRKLCFLVDHPELRVKPRESPSTEPEPVRPPTPPPEPAPSPKSGPGRKKWTISNAGRQLAARTEYTKGEIQRMLESMEERIAVVERDVQAADEGGEEAVDAVLEQKNFSTLHKQYESIRAELINTLNS
jgi:hypothetical protein